MMENKILIVAQTEVAKVFEAFGLDLLLVSHENALEEVSKINIGEYVLIIYQSNLVEQLRPLVKKYEAEPTPIFLNIPIEKNDKDEALTVLRDTIENTLGVQII